MDKDEINAMVKLNAKLNAEFEEARIQRQEAKRWHTLLSEGVNREWVSLTDDEIKAIIGHNHPEGIGSYARELFEQIEAKLREKNCG